VAAFFRRKDPRQKCCQESNKHLALAAAEMKVRLSKEHRGKAATMALLRHPNGSMAVDGNNVTEDQRECFLDDTPSVLALK